ADVHHPDAMAISKMLMENRCRLAVTPFVFAEVYAIFSRRPNVRQQIVRDVWQNPIVRIEQPTYQDQQEALALLKSHSDKSFSFCDALSFVVMNRLGLRAAISFDDHFRQYGKFEVIDGSDL